MGFLKRLKKPLWLYACIRCDAEPVPYPLMRCDACENTVVEILFEAALEGRPLEDPLVKMRKKCL